MPIRTLQDLEATLTEDLKWRKAELDTIDQMIKNSRRHQESALIRSGITLLYAHWEGYVKLACCAYLEYINYKGLDIQQLRDELVAVTLRGIIIAGEMSKQAEDHTRIVRHVRGNSGEKAILPFNKATIKTNNNLGFDTFTDVMHSIGCDTPEYASYNIPITRLVKRRNSIAHGDRELSTTQQDWEDIFFRVHDAMKRVRTQISNSATMEEFRV